MQAQALTRTRFLYILNVIISHPIVYKEGLGYLSVCDVLSPSPLPPTCVFVTVNKARRYFASTVNICAPRLPRKQEREMRPVILSESLKKQMASLNFKKAHRHICYAMFYCSSSFRTPLFVILENTGCLSWLVQAVKCRKVPSSSLCRNTG
jgi:hypothetical protein